MKKLLVLSLWLSTAVLLVPRPAGAQTIIPGTTTDNTNGTPFNITTNGSSYLLQSGSTYQLRAATDSHGIRINANTVTLSIQGALVTENLLSTNSDNSALRVSGSAIGNTVTVGGISNTSASILSKGNDAVKFTGTGASANVLTNYGTIRSEGRVNTTGGSTYEVSDGVNMGSGNTVNNYGTISGARHGIDGGAIASVTVNNYAGGFLIGRNGSGIGADTTSALANNYVVNNSGTIRGDYAGVGNIFDRTNTASINGDGDGIDIDGAATINNFSTGQILSTGAGGYDSGSRANNSEAISIGGGIIINDGLIRGATHAIIVNNDSALSRSGVAASSITNSFGATIEGQNGFAIRLENKLGGAGDNDTINNAGTIIGSGTVPAPTDTVYLQNGTTPDPNSAGTLDGVTYTGTGSARFIRGDGSAIQMGEGADILTNTGTITGSNGRAINMEGGDDTVNFNAGTVTGLINGGAGTNTLNLGTGVSTSSAIQSFQNINVATGTATLSNTVSGTTLAKGGAGTLVLSGANSFTGATTVSNGTLRVNNTTGSATGSGDVTVSAGATLAGAGTIGGNVLLDGILAPGNSIGVLSVDGNLTWDGTVANAWVFELGVSNTADLLHLGGSFLKGTGTLFQFDFQNSSDLGTFTLVEWSGTTDFAATDFSPSNLAGGHQGTFAINSGKLEFTVVPEPNTALLLLVAGAGLWSRRRCTGAARSSVG